MRLLLVQDTDWLKRDPAQQHHLAEMLSLRGYETRVIDYEIPWRAQRQRGLYSRRQIFSNVSKLHQGSNITVIRPSIVKIPLLDNISLLISHRSEIKRQIKDFAPDVIIGFGILNSYLAARAAQRGGIPFIYYWIDVLHRLIPVKQFQPIAKIMEKRTLRDADRVLVINAELKDYVIRMGASPERSHVLGAGINFQQFDRNVNGNQIRKQYGIKESDVVLFFMGWLYHFSGLKEVALELARRPNSHFKLLVVGGGDAYNALQEIREKHDLQDKLILTGRKPYQELPPLVAASDICLLPAYTTEKIMRDIIPIKMYEYMAMAKPIIATGLPGVVREFGYDNGIVYISRPEEVVDKAMELVKNGSLKELGLKARAFVEKYSWANITDKFEGILEEVIREKNA